MQSPSILLIIRTAFILLILAFAPMVRAAGHTVFMTDSFTFSPSFLEIEVGDTVTWFNSDSDDHDATSDTSLWGTGNVLSGDSATLLFNTPGTYPYRDSFWWPLGMTGTLVVKVATPSPAVLTNPMRLPNGAFRFTITNLTPGKVNVVAVSTNLQSWTPIFTNTPGSNSFDFTNAAAAIVPYQFYRSSQIP